MLRYAPLLVLGVVFLLIAVRQIGRFRLPIWLIMLLGALTVLSSRRISVRDAARAVNLDVMLFLFGMFVVGKALEESGYLLNASHRLFQKARRPDSLVLLILFSMGILSALLMNDTIAVIGTPLVLYLARQHGISPKLLLLTLAFAVTTGSVMSPIGNPQNLLIAVSTDIGNPFITFLAYLALPTIVSLLFAFLLLRFYHRGEFEDRDLSHAREPIRDERLALLCRISLLIILVLVAAKVLIVSLGLGFDFRLTDIALAASLPILVGSRKRFSILRGIDWKTLVFFAAMFVLMQSVWESGLIQDLIGNVSFTSVPLILGSSITVSQLISNVPFVALILPLLGNTGVSSIVLMALAAGSTLAGNLFVLGAASNVIVIQSAEARGETVTFLEFARVGLPLTILSALAYGVFLSLPLAR